MSFAFSGKDKYSVSSL